MMNAAREHGSPCQILLVNPSYPSSSLRGRALPVGLGALSEFLSAQEVPHEVCDMTLDGERGLHRRVETLAPTYVGFSMMSLDVQHNYGVIERLRQRFPRVKTVVGGPHASFVGPQVLRECSAIDLVITHEGEFPLVQLLRGTPYPEIPGLIWRNESGEVGTGRKPSFNCRLDGLPFPRYSAFNVSRYSPTIPIASSRGCPFSCTFCGAHLSMGKKWRGRSAESIVEEIEYWHRRGYRSFSFIDSNFFLSHERVREICRLLQERRLEHLVLNVDGMRASDADEVTLRQLKAFGLSRVAIGVESANDDVLANIKKGEDLASFRQCMELLERLDISPILFFVIGLPGETWRHVLRSFRFALEVPNATAAIFYNLNPTYGTELYDWADRNGYLRMRRMDMYSNIGGMAPKCLIQTPEFPVWQRQLLYALSSPVSSMVRTRHRARRVVARLRRLSDQTGLKSLFEPR